MESLVETPQPEFRRYYPQCGPGRHGADVCDAALGDGESPLTYHSKTYHSKPLGRWDVKRRDCTILDSVSPGQEFVLDASQYPKAFDWVRSLMTHAIQKTCPTSAL